MVINSMPWFKRILGIQQLVGTIIYWRRTKTPNDAAHMHTSA